MTIGLAERNGNGAQAQTQTKLGILTFRDGQQSTLDANPDAEQRTKWNFNVTDWSRALFQAGKAGFTDAEVAGGQSFQTAIKFGYNPFKIVDHLSLINLEEDGTPVINLQMLFRGANALGFRHYAPDVIRATLNEFINSGIKKVRFFDALNDVDNIYIPDEIKDKGLVVQGALSFCTYKDQPDRYTDAYFANYAKALVNKGCNSIAIKDMSGQMTPKRIESLLKALREAVPGTEIELHIHSTNEEMSEASARRALELGIDRLETVEGPLNAGSAHHKIETIDKDLSFVKLTKKPFETMKVVLDRIFGRKTRKDTQISQANKERLCALGVPGGAMPFVIADLKKNTSSIVGRNQEFFKEELEDFPQVIKHKDKFWNKVLDLFEVELKRVCQDAGYPPLVTPTADICVKQAIRNMCFADNLQGDSLSDRYNLKMSDPRFIKLILGHYGQMKAYDGTDKFIQADQAVIEFFNNSEVKVNGEDQTVSLVEGHTYLNKLKLNEEEMPAAYAEADALIEKYGYKALSFGTRDQLAVMYALKPSGGGNKDVIETALGRFIKRSLAEETSFIDSQSKSASFFEGFRFLVNPIFRYVDNLKATGREVKDPFNLKLVDMGRLAEDIFEVYKKLPIMKRAGIFLKAMSARAKRLSASLDTDEKVHLEENLANLSRIFKEKIETGFNSFQWKTLRDLVKDLHYLWRILGDSQNLLENLGSKKREYYFKKIEGGVNAALNVYLGGMEKTSTGRHDSQSGAISRAVTERLSRTALPADPVIEEISVDSSKSKAQA